MTTSPAARAEQTFAERVAELEDALSEMSPAPWEHIVHAWSNEIHFGEDIQNATITCMADGSGMVLARNLLDALLACIRQQQSALRKLSNEVMASAEMARDCIGNTNTACLIQRAKEAQAILAKFALQGGKNG